MKTEKTKLEKFEEDIFGYEKAVILIPKETHAMVITTVSDTKSGKFVIHSNTYGDKEIKEVLE